MRIFFSTDLLNPLVGPEQVLLFRVRVELGVMVMEGYFLFTRSPELEHHHQILFNVIPSTFFLFGEESYSPAEDTVSVFSADRAFEKLNYFHRFNFLKFFPISFKILSLIFKLQDS